MELVHDMTNLSAASDKEGSVFCVKRQQSAVWIVGARKRLPTKERSL
jgi:hypothetical protein